MVHIFLLKYAVRASPFHLWKLNLKQFSNWQRYSTRMIWLRRHMSSTQGPVPQRLWPPSTVHGFFPWFQRHRSEVEPRNNRLSGLLCTQQGKMGSSFAVKIYISLFLGPRCSPFPITHIAVWVFFFLWAAAAISDTPHVLLATKP